MLELFVVGAFVAFGVLAIAGLALIAVVVKLFVWLIFLPIRLLFYLLLLPLLIFKAVFGLLFGAAFAVILVPIVLAGLGLTLLGATAALLVPGLLFLLAISFIVWLFRSPSRPLPAAR